MAPLHAEAAMLALPVEGHASAMVSVPLGTTVPRPLVIAAHGNFDRPEWQCEQWRELVGERAFVLCPRGIPRPDSPGPDDVRFHYANNQSLERELVAAIEALRGRFGDYVDIASPLYTGFSQGAIMGIPIASRPPARFSRMVLTEGGHDNWNPSTTASFRELGGDRVLFVCGTKGCVSAAERAVRHLKKAGVETRVLHASGHGHSYGGAMNELTRHELAWLLAGDARFTR